MTASIHWRCSIVAGNTPNPHPFQFLPDFNILCNLISPSLYFKSNTLFVRTIDHCLWLPISYPWFILANELTVAISGFCCHWGGAIEQLCSSCLISLLRSELAFEFINGLMEQTCLWKKH